MNLVKKVLLNTVGAIVFFFVSGVILNLIFDDTDLSLSISGGIVVIYFFILSIISLIRKTKNDIKEFKTLINYNTIIRLPLYFIWWLFLLYLFLSCIEDYFSIDDLASNILSFTLTSFAIYISIVLLASVILWAISTIQSVKEEKIPMSKNNNKSTFSTNVYNKQNGQIFIIFLGITFICFLFFLYTMYTDIEMEYIMIVSELLGFTAMFGFIGFIFAICLYVGQLKAYSKSELILEDNQINYIKQTFSGITLLGYTTEYQVYTVTKVNGFDISKRWIKIYGEIEKQEVYRGREYGDKKIVDSIKIARAFETDKEIITFLNESNK